MSRSFHFFFSFILILFAGCEPAIPSTEEANIRPQAVESLTSTVSATLLPRMTRTPARTATNVPTMERTKTPARTQSPIPSPTSKAKKEFLPFPSPEPNGNVVRNCLSVEDSSINPLSEGFLILDYAPFNFLFHPSNPYRLDLSNGQKVDLRPDLINYPEADFVSPDKTKLFYIEKSPTSTHWKVVISSVAENQLAVADWDEAWGVKAKWLDNQRIIVTPPRESTYVYGTQIVIDPFTNTWQELRPEFSKGLNIDVFSVHYNPAMDRVLYLSGNFYVLDNTFNHQALWIGGLNGASLPMKIPGNNVFVLALGQHSPNARMKSYNELFQVDQNGLETQLTHLSKSYSQYPWIYIDNLNISPNGKYIALQISIGSDEGKVTGPILMIYDYDQKRLTDTCLVVATKYLSWSPDGKLVGFSIPKDTAHFLETRHTVIPIEAQTVILDIEQWTAWKIEEDAAVMGWMVE